jgi:uncharacterized beta-barrel protein YwiB (DUF1934 family)
MQDVVLTIRGRQLYDEQEPEVVELVTEGTLEKLEDGWSISYEESALTGLEGVKTNFMLQPGKITLSRSGRLQSQMVFQVGVLHESLYRMDFGAMMIGVCAVDLDYHMTDEGGTVELAYRIDIEHSAGGIVEYFLEVKKK